MEINKNTRTITKHNPLRTPDARLTKHLKRKVFASSIQTVRCLVKRGPGDRSIAMNKTDLRYQNKHTAQKNHR